MSRKPEVPHRDRYFSNYGNNFQQLVPVNKQGKHQATDTAAALIRSQFEDWKRRFFPIEKQLLSETTYGNPNLVNERVAAAQSDVTSQYDTAAAQADRNLAAFGVAPTEEQAGARARMMGLSKATSMVDAANRTRQQVQDETRQLMIGGASALRG
jgi:hypothetical protein